MDLHHGGARSYPAAGGPLAGSHARAAHARGRRAARHPCRRGRERHRRAGRLSGALAERALVPALDAPWLALSVVALALLHPMMGAVAAACAALCSSVSLDAGPPARASGAEVAEARKGTATWWLAATLSPSLPAGAADEWAQLDRAHITGAYALGKRTPCCRTPQACCGRARRSPWSRSARGSSLAHELTLSGAVRLRADQRAAAGAAGASHRLAAARAWRAVGPPPPGGPPRPRSERAHRVSASAAPCPPNPAAPQYQRPAGARAHRRPAFRRGSLGAAFTRLGDLAALAGGALFETQLTPVDAAQEAASPRGCTCATAPACRRRPHRHAR